MSAPAGWYPDPDSPPSRRYWDGAHWTEHRQAPVSAVSDLASRRTVETNTVWVWLAIAASVVPFAVPLLLDWDRYLTLMLQAASNDGVAPGLLGWELQSLAVSMLSWVAIAAAIVFCWLDWRELRRRGVVAPFHWAWAFFALASGGLAVYMIGRAVVLRRRTVAGGWPPLWTWIGVTVVGYAIILFWVIALVRTLVGLLWMVS